MFLHALLLCSAPCVLPGLVWQDDGDASAQLSEQYAELRFVPATEPYVDDANFPEGIHEIEEDALLRSLRLVTGRAAVNDKPWWPRWMPKEGPLGEVGWYNRLLVSPRHKFAFCFMDKNAGTQFNALMNFLNEMDPIGAPWFRSSWARTEGLELETISRSTGWRFATFVRDPAERFLAAVLSKCQDWEEGGLNCMGRSRPSENETEVQQFERIAREFLPVYENYRADRGFWNAHYDPQTTFCGNMSEYDFVGHLTGNYTDVHRQVAHMLESIAKVSPSHPVWDHLDKLFPTSHPAKTGGHKKSTKSRDKMALFYGNPKTYAAIASVYAKDYVEFSLPRGSYVSTAQ